MITPQDLHNKADLLPLIIDQLFENRQRITDGLATLQSAGITNASTYYRDGRYLYLIHPTAEDGSRQREYIGKDPTKIAQAMGRLERYQIHTELKSKLRALDQAIQNGFYDLEQAKRRLGNALEFNW